MNDLKGPGLDPRIVQTRRQLTEALLELASPAWRWNITVSQLCKQAAVSRPTFYQHYSGVDGVYRDLLADRLRSIVNPVEAADRDAHPIESVFVDLRENEGFYAPVLGQEAAFPASRHQFHEWIMDKMSRTAWGAALDELPVERQQRAVFAAGGLVFTMTSWAYSRGALGKESPHDAVKRVQEYVSALMEG